MSFGGFAGYNAAGSDETVVTTTEDVRRAYGTASAHLYWGERPGSQPVRLKLDAVGIRYQEAADVTQRSVGVSGFGAVRVLGTASCSPVPSSSGATPTGRARPTGRSG